MLCSIALRSVALTLAASLAALAAGPLALFASDAAAAAPCHPTSASARVLAVESVGFTVADLDRSIEFFSRLLEFTLESRREFSGEAWEQLDGLFPVRKEVATLRLGDERVCLTQYLAPRGRPIPHDRASTDGAFQHVAIVVADMDRAYQRLRSAGVRHVSSEPQTLPASNPAAGGIKAFYFEDPDGHILELIAFPPGKGHPRWHDTANHGDRLFLGIDHTAIGVRATGPALTFYRDLLGFQVAGRSENHGPEQARLNAVRGAHLEITSLRPPGGAPGVAIEFLDYIEPTSGRPTPDDLAASDILHWQVTLRVEALSALVTTLTEHGAVIASEGIIALPAGRACLLRDPDGHALCLVERSDA